MWRTLTCLGLMAALPGFVCAQEDVKVRDLHGKVVRVDPTSSLVVLRTGTGADVKEVEFKFAPTVKVWGTDQQVLAEAARFPAMKQGADVWYRLDADNRLITELRMFDPAAIATYQSGKVVRVDPDKNIIIISVGAGAEAKEVEYKVVPTTRYYGTAETQVINDALRYQGFRPGADVWYVPGQGQVISDVRFYNPRLLPRRR
jgi:hypothetical protein